MDRKIEKSKWEKNKNVILISLGALVVIMFLGIFSRDKSKKLNIESDYLNIGEVFYGDFEEFTTVTGITQPSEIIYIDAFESGVISDIYIEEGKFVKKGEKLLKLQDINLQLDIMNRETTFAEQLNDLRNTQIVLEQNKNSIETDILDYEYQLKQQRKDYEKKAHLFEKKLISEQEYEDEKDSYLYLKDKLALLKTRAEQDSIFREIQLRQITGSVHRIEENMTLTRGILDNLEVKAPISGQIANLNAVLGERKVKGQRLAQINILDYYKVQANIDEHYISQVFIGLKGNVEINNVEYILSIKKVYPEVANGFFKVDLEFDDAQPEDIRIGQSFRLKLQLGSPEKALLLPRGSFYNENGGQWVYVLDKEGKSASKRELLLGRQNPIYYEVLNGLSENEQVIISGYKGFGDASILILK